MNSLRYDFNEFGIKHFSKMCFLVVKMLEQLYITGGHLVLNWLIATQVTKLEKNNNYKSCAEL